MPKSKRTKSTRSTKRSTRSKATSQTTADFWHSVTPWSKITAAVLFISLPFFAFAFGMKYGRVTAFLYEYACSYDDPGAVHRTRYKRTPTVSAAETSVEGLAEPLSELE